MGSPPFQVLVAKRRLWGEDTKRRGGSSPRPQPRGRTRSKHGTISVCSGAFQALPLMSGARGFFFKAAKHRGLHPVGEGANPRSEELRSSTACSGRQMGRERSGSGTSWSRGISSTRSPPAAPLLAAPSAAAHRGVRLGGHEAPPGCGAPRCIISKAFVNKEGGKKKPNRS